MKPEDLKDVPFPKCSDNCEAMALFGVGECDSICPEKFIVSKDENDFDTISIAEYLKKEE